MDSKPPISDADGVVFLFISILGMSSNTVSASYMMNGGMRYSIEVMYHAFLAISITLSPL